MIYNVDDIQQNETSKQRSEAVGVSQETWGGDNGQKIVGAEGTIFAKIRGFGELQS